MPRQSRLHSMSGVYHIMMRGNEKKDIFIDNEDRYKFIDILLNKKFVSGYSLYAYCLMSNHIHLVMKENDENLALCLKRINVSYAYYFNKKYIRVGHLFQDRFKSECIDSEEYLLSAIRYIHNNPVKAKVAAMPYDYPWSSYNSYINIKDNNLLIDKYEILSIFSSNIKSAMQSFIIYSQKSSDDCFIDCHEGDDDTKKISSVSSAKSYIESYLLSNSITLADIKDKAYINHRNNIIAYLKSNSNLSIREIGSLLNLDRNMVSRVK